MSTFYVEVVTPYRMFFSGEVESLILKTIDGEMGVMDNHIPMVVVVDVGPLKIKQNGKWIEAVLTEGFMEITREKVIIIVDTAEWPDEIDKNRALAAKMRAENRLRSQLSKVEYVRSKAAMARAMARLKIASKR